MHRCPGANTICSLSVLSTRVEFRPFSSQCRRSPDMQIQCVECNILQPLAILPPPSIQTRLPRRIGRQLMVRMFIVMSTRLPIHHKSRRNAVPDAQLMFIGHRTPAPSAQCSCRGAAARASRDAGASPTWTPFLGVERDVQDAAALCFCFGAVRVRCTVSFDPGGQGLGPTAHCAALG